MGWVNFADKYQRYGRLSKKESLGLLVSTVVLAFIFSFREWGVEEFNFSIGIQNFLIAAMVVAISLFVRLLVQKSTGLSVGHKVEYQAWIVGLFVGLIAAFFTNGHFWIFLPGGIAISHLSVHRLGRALYGENYNVMGWIAMSGPIANMILAIIAKILLLLPFGSSIFFKLMMFNIWLAIFTMLPIPPLDGLKTFFGSRYVYVFAYACIIGCGVLLYFFGAVASIIGAIVFGAIAVSLFFIYFDKKFEPASGR